MNTARTAGCAPSDITTGPDGAMWFTENCGNDIGRMTTGGTYSSFAIPTTSSWPRGIAAGPDGALWFVESAVSKVGRLQ